MRHVKQAIFVVVAGSLSAIGLFMMFREESLQVVVDGRVTTFARMAPEQLDMRAGRDAAAFKRLVNNTIRLEKRLAEQSAMFDKRPDDGLTADERREALALFEAVIDNTVALDTLARFHLDFWHVNALTDRERHARHFALFFATYVEKLALGLALIDKTINKPQFEKLFDEGNQAMGIAPGS